MRKAHGLDGETVVELTGGRPERSAVGATFDTDAGTLVVEQSRPFQGRWLIRFEGVHSREAADALRGTVLRARAIADPEVLWVHELVGAEAVRQADGVSLGVVKAVLANPASDLLELEDGTLVPARFVVEHGAGRVVVDVPDGIGP